MPEIISYTERLKQKLQQIEQKMMELLAVSTIREFHNDFDAGVVFVRPKYYWGETDERQKLLQMELLKEYSLWIEHFRLLFRDASQEMSTQIDEVDKFVVSWIQKESSWEIPATIQEAQSIFREKVRVFYDLIGLLDGSSGRRIILVPDTNALIAAPDVSQYKDIIGQSNFTVVLLPTVLEELDKLKITHREQSFRDKVRSVIRRIKGWRNQGSLLEGVKVHKSIIVRAVATEPNFQRTLHWLDPMNKDDRIIASALELQRDNPASVVVLVTADINLQNKAEMAKLPYLEPPGS